MALQKQNLSLNFAKGVDTKTDPWQVMAGSMLSLQNAIFTKGGLLQKRNGFGALTSLTLTAPTTLGTFGGGLIAIGNNLKALSENTAQWINQGSIQPLNLSVTTLVRRSTGQTTVDVAVASNGLACVTWIDTDGNSYYQVVVSATGQVVVPVTQLPSTATMPRCFFLGNYFVITFLATVSASSYLRYIAIPSTSPTAPSAATDISSQASSLSAGYNGVIYNNNLYLALNGSDGGGAIRISYLDSTLTLHGPVVLSSYTATRIAMAADSANGNIYITLYDGTNVKTCIYNSSLTSVLSPTTVLSSVTLTGITSVAVSGVMTLFYQTSNTYSYSSTRTDFVKSITMTQAGVVGTATAVLRGVGIASKAFYFSPTATAYLLVSYAGSYQPTYFLIDSNGNIISKLAYNNGAGYAINQVLPSVSISGNTASVGYLFKDLVQPVNKSQGVSSTSGIYSQTGINLASFEIGASASVMAEIGNNLHLSGGFITMYDGVKPVEHGFHVWPEDIGVTTSTSGGSITAQQYYYYATYEWTDAQGNIHRSAPSIPMGITTTGSSSTNTIKVPTLRLTAKAGVNKVKICLYRWSTAQQIPYLVTSISSPTLNDTTADSVTITDTLADSSIIGNLILYTFGGVLENIAASPSAGLALYKGRLVSLDAENRNQLWFSKQVVQGVPVEMNDALTAYIAPTLGSQGSTGPTTVISAMDDKLIEFKSGAIYYQTGNGPDNTGANNDLSDPVFITSTVGCTNPQSIVFIPQGLMFQSDKGIWLLGRDLSTQYIGAPVESYTQGASVLSAVGVPGTNQVRFTLDSGVTLMYDYFFGQWGTFTNVPAISSTIYAGLHTYLRADGAVFRETEGDYLDGGRPVLLSFTTAWIQMGGVQGYERAYSLYLLGKFLSPHKLSVSVAYDYNSSANQTTLISPDNYNNPYGVDAFYGDPSTYGGSSNVEQWQVYFSRQKCQALQLTITEIYDASYDVGPGQGLTLSTLNLQIGIKSGVPRLPQVHSVG